MRESLNYMQDADDLRELLFKYHVTTAGISWNFELFNQQLEEETRDEDEALSQLISTSRMIDLQGYMNTLFETADQMQTDLTSVMGEVNRYVKLAGSL